jgi:hypothetical protein
MRRGGALRHPDRSAPRPGLRFALGIQDTVCQIKLFVFERDYSRKFVAPRRHEIERPAKNLSSVAGVLCRPALHRGVRGVNRPVAEATEANLVSSAGLITSKRPPSDAPAISRRYKGLS